MAHQFSFRVWPRVARSGEQAGAGASQHLAPRAANHKDLYTGRGICNARRVVCSWGAELDVRTEPIRPSQPLTCSLIRESWMDRSSWRCPGSQSTCESSVLHVCPAYIHASPPRAPQVPSFNGEDRSSTPRGHSPEWLDLHSTHGLDRLLLSSSATRFAWHVQRASWPSWHCTNFGMR